MSINRKTPPKDSSQLAEMNQEERNTQSARDSFNNLQEGVFKAVVISGWGNIGGGGNYNKGARMIAKNYTKQKVGNLRWYRIRALDGSDDARESLWKGTKGNIPRRDLRYTRAVSIIQYHRPAFFKAAASAPPKAGEVWYCRYLKKRWQTPIMLIEQTADDNWPAPLVYPDTGVRKREGQLLDKAKFPDPGSEHESPYLYRGEMDYDDAIAMVNKQNPGQGIKLLMKFVADNLHQGFYPPSGMIVGAGGVRTKFDTEYDLFHCGYGHTGPLSCKEAARAKYDAFLNKVLSLSGTTIAGSKITETPIKDLDKDLKNGLGKGPNTDKTKGDIVSAAGRYDCTHLALRDALVPDSFPGFKFIYDTENFHKDAQDAIFMWEIFLHYPVIGGYLIGVHDDSIYAADQLAHIWTVFPAQRTRWEDEDNNHIKKKTKSTDKKILRDYSYYYWMNEAHKQGDPTEAVPAWEPGAVLTTTKFTTHIGSGHVVLMLEQVKKQFLARLEELRKNGQDKALVEKFTYP